MFSQQSILISQYTSKYVYDPNQSISQAFPNDFSKPLRDVQNHPLSETFKNVIISKISCDCNYHHVNIITERGKTLSVFLCCKMDIVYHETKGKCSHKFLEIVVNAKHS